MRLLLMVVKQKFIGDANDLLRDYEKLEQRAAKLEQANARLASETKKGSDDATQAFNRQSDSLQNVSAKLRNQFLSWQAVTTAIRAASQALEENRRLNREAGETQTTVSDAQAKVIKNLGGVSREEKLRFLSAIGGIQEEVGYSDLAALNLAAASGISASAGNRPRTLEALRQSARISREAPDELPAFVGGALDVAKASGVEDARANLGFLLSAGGLSRVTDLQQQVANIAPAVANAVETTRGNRVERSIEAGALYAALSTVADDEKGQASSTAESLYAVKLRDFFEEKGLQDPGTIRGRLQVLQGNQALSDEFLDKVGGEARFKIAFEQLARGGQAFQLFEQFSKQISFDPKVFEDTARDLKTLTPQLARAAAVRESAGSFQAFEFEQDLAGRAAASQRIVEETINKTNRGFGRQFFSAIGIGKQIPLADFEALTQRGMSPEAAGRLILQREEERIRLGASASGSAAIPGATEETHRAALQTLERMGYHLRSDEELSPLDRANIEELRKQTAILERMERSSAQTAEASRNKGPQVNPAGQVNANGE